MAASRAKWNVDPRRLPRRKRTRRCIRLRALARLRRARRGAGVSRLPARRTQAEGPVPHRRQGPASCGRSADRLRRGDLCRRRAAAGYQVRQRRPLPGPGRKPRAWDAEKAKAVEGSGWSRPSRRGWPCCGRHVAAFKGREALEADDPVGRGENAGVSSADVLARLSSRATRGRPGPLQPRGRRRGGARGRGARAGSQYSIRSRPTRRSSRCARSPTSARDAARSGRGRSIPTARRKTRRRRSDSGVGRHRSRRRCSGAVSAGRASRTSCWTPWNPPAPPKLRPGRLDAGRRPAARRLPLGDVSTDSVRVSTVGEAGVLETHGLRRRRIARLTGA